MGYFNFENGVSAANDANLNTMQKGLMELVFPIGSTYITQNDTNPNTILEFGTWERLKGKVCLGIDEDDEDLDTVGKTGGEKTHKLTTQEMPSHTHALNNNTLVNRNIPGSGRSARNNNGTGSNYNCK